MFDGSWGMGCVSGLDGAGHSYSKTPLEQDPMRVPFNPQSHPKHYIAQFDAFNNMMGALHIGKTTYLRLPAMIRQLPREYSVQHAVLEHKPSVTCKEVEGTIWDAFAEKRTKQIMQSFSTTALSAA